jgi:arginase
LTTLRLEWPQWQGGDPEAVVHYTSGLSYGEAQSVYGLGGQLTAVLAPPTRGPTARVTVPEFVAEQPIEDGIIGKAEVMRQHDEALSLIREHGPDSIVTLGGTCAVSLMPFSYLADRYADDLAVIWLDSHADCNLPGGPNRGFNTMVVTHLSGRGDGDVLAQLPATVRSDRILLAGVHGWDDQVSETHESWGLRLIAPDSTTTFVTNVVDWIRGTGVRQVALHFDLDVIDSQEHAFGMAWETEGISEQTALRTIAAVAEEFSLVGLTIAEFVPREAAALRTILGSVPLLSPGHSSESE